MCLAIPVKIKEISKEKVISMGNKEIDVTLITDKLHIGDYLLVHDSLAVNKLPKQEAEKIIDVVNTCSHAHTGETDHEHTHDHAHSYTH